MGTGTVFKFKATAAATLIVLAGTTQAIGGNYLTGVQIGSAPTPTQQAFRDDQMRIRYQSEFLHESEHRNGAKMLYKIGKEVFKKIGRTIRGEKEEYMPLAPTEHTVSYD